MRYLFTCFSLLFLLMAGCRYNDQEKMTEVEGYRPVYVSREDMERIVSMAPHPLQNAGKIYVRGHYVFVNEIERGIHIIDNLQPTQPQPVSFISIPGNVDLAVKGNIMYADNGPDLVALDISNPEQTRLVKRISNVFPNSMHPPQTGVAFECVDNSRGIVVSWEKAKLTNPRCHR